MNPLYKIEKVVLKDIPLFSELDSKDLQQISDFSAAKNYNKNNLIFTEGDKYIGFYIVLKGKVKVFKLAPSGKESVIHIVRPFDTFAEMPLFEGLIGYPVNAEALEDSTLFFIPSNEFINFICNNPGISMKMMGGMAKKLHLLTKRIESLTLTDLPNRLAKYLIDEQNKTHKVILARPFVLLSVPKATLAGLLGTITETLSRTFKKLQDDDIIEVKGKKIYINDLPRLKDLSK